MMLRSSMDMRYDDVSSISRILSLCHGLCEQVSDASLTGGTGLGLKQVRKEIVLHIELKWEMIWDSISHSSGVPFLS
jgi:hypothetical protein